MTIDTIDTADVYTALTENSSILSEEEKKGLYLALTNSSSWQDTANTVLKKLNAHAAYYPEKVLLEGWKHVRNERTAYCCVMDSLVSLVVLRAWYMRSAPQLKACFTGSENSLEIMADKVFRLEDAYSVAIELMTTGGATASADVVCNITMCIGKLLNKLHVMHKDVLVRTFNEAVVIIKGNLDAAF